MAQKMRAAEMIFRNTPPLWLWFRYDKHGSDACELKEEEIVRNGQAAAAQAPVAKRKSPS